MYDSITSAKADGYPTRIGAGILSLRRVNELAGYVKKLRQANSGRSFDESLQIAIAAFQRSHKIIGGEWVPVPAVRLGANEDGPFLLSRFVDDDARRRAVVKEATLGIGACIEEANGSVAAKGLSNTCSRWLFPLCNGEEIGLQELRAVSSMLSTAAALETKSRKTVLRLRNVVEEEIRKWESSST